jgi:hypothetical protein
MNSIHGGDLEHRHVRKRGKGRNLTELAIIGTETETKFFVNPGNLGFKKVNMNRQRQK